MAQRKKPTMPTVKVTKAFTVNMGNFESYRPEFSLEMEVEGEDPNAVQLAFDLAQGHVDKAAYHDLEEAASISDVRNTYILTWLKNREDIANA